MRRPPPRVGVLPALLATLAACVLFSATVNGRFVFDYGDRLFCWDANSGEALLHGLPSSIEEVNWWHMPAGETLNALLCNHAPAGASIGVAMLLAALYPLLVFGLGLQLFSPAAGLLAALASLGVITIIPDETIILQHGLLVMCAAIVAAWRAEKPDSRRTCVLAAVIGLSLLTRSQLFLFLPLWLLLESLSRPPGKRSESWRLFAVCALLLFIFVAPWALLHVKNSGVFNPFEWGWPRPTQEIKPMLQYEEAFVFDDGSRTTSSAYYWAATRALSHPAAYAAAVIRRCLHSVLLSPFLWTLGLLAAWDLRRSAPARAVAALALYLLVMENLIAMARAPASIIWPLLAALIAAAVFNRLAKKEPSSLPLKLAAMVLVPFTVLAAFAAAQVLRYPRRAAVSPQAAFDRAISEHPEDPALRSLRGRELLRQGKPAQALEDLALALSLQPTKRRELDFAVALGLRGGPAQGLIDSIRLDRVPAPLNDIWVRVTALKLLGSLHRGDRSQAVAAAAAGQLSIPGMSSAPIEGAGGSTELYAMLKSCGRLPEYWPPLRRLELFDRLQTLGPPDPWFQLYAAQTAHQAGRPARARALADDILASSEAPPALRERSSELLAAMGVDAAAGAARSGRRAAALKLLAEAQARGPNAPDQLRMALIYQELKEFSSAARLFDDLIMASPEDLQLHMSAAAAAVQMGNRSEALVLLGKAETLGPDAQVLRQMAALYKQLKEYASALRVLELILKTSPEDRSLRIEAADVAAQAGERARALKQLAEAEALGPNAGERQRMALLYQELKEYREARRLFAGLLRAAPRDHRLRIEAAAAAAQAGERGEALKLLAGAAALGPDAEARRRMALLYRELKEYGAAGSLFAELMKGDRGNARLRVEAATVAADAGKRAETLALLAEAASLKPDAELRHQMALLHQRFQEYAAAVSLLGELARADDADARILNDLGVCQYLNGALPASIETLERALRRDPRLAEAYLTLGSVYMAQKRVDQALMVYDSALAAKAGKDSPLEEQIHAGRRAALAAPRPR